MNLTRFGDHPLTKDSNGQLISRIGSIHPALGVLITLPRMNHALQRIHYTNQLNGQRALQGLPPLSDDEKEAVWSGFVDLIMTGDDVLIRPETDKMGLAFQADERLHELVPKHHVRFLRAHESAVQNAVRERGECWRIAPYPLEEAEILAAIAKSRIALGGEPIYYYSAGTGTRFLTCQSFADLAAMPPDDLRRHLVEIAKHAALRNRLYQPEVAFFGADPALFGPSSFASAELAAADDAQIRARHSELAACFSRAVPEALRRDDPGSAAWRNHLFACLWDAPNDTVTNPLIQDLTPEFYRMIRWLPGGRIENGELIFDTLFDQRKRAPDDPELRALCDERVKGFIANYVREFGDLEYVNVGGVAPALGHRRANGHRVYLAEVKSRAADKPVLRILRVQQWGIREHLDLGRDLLWAVTAAMEYTEYTLDRRLACWQLGMPLPARIDTRMTVESYGGAQARYRSYRHWTTYYERPFIRGLATNRLPDGFLRNADHAAALARLLGQAAAPNLAVGRTAEDGSAEAVFDCGDEMILTDGNGRPDRIVIADHAGTFNNDDSPLAAFAAAYAAPVVARASKVPDPALFESVYLAALGERLTAIQTECRERRAAFLALFQNSRQGPRTFSDRWARVLDRLDQTDVPSLVARIRAEIHRQLAAP